MIVLKLGGSLLSQTILQQWLSLANQKGKGQLIIVPGGGVFADQVRKTQKYWQYNDGIAHQMAILAMHQMALLFQGLCTELVLVREIDLIPKKLLQNKVLIWLPEISELDALAIPATWDISSDSLAIILAKQLNVKATFLIKSAQIPQNNNLQQLKQIGIIDHACAEMAEKLAVNVKCLQSNQLSFFANILVNHG
jgi:aspartokinase-like uncharacterized kinase